MRKTVETAKIVDFIAKLRAKSDVWTETGDACALAGDDKAALRAHGKAFVYADNARDLEKIIKG